jgi:hypothetical protein
MNANLRRPSHRRRLAIALCLTGVACSSAPPSVEPGVDPFVPGSTLFEDEVAVDPDAAIADGARDDTGRLLDGAVLDSTGDAPASDSFDAGFVDVVSLDTRDSASPVDTAVAVDTFLVDTALPDTKPVDTGLPPTDTAVPCADPGGVLYAGHCYFRAGAKQPYDIARTTCGSRGAHLVTITSAAEQSFVQSLGLGEAWLGLSRPLGAPPVPSSYVWITGEPVTFTKWQIGEPNGSGVAVRMIFIDWSDTSSSSLYEAICERE